MSTNKPASYFSSNAFTAKALLWLILAIVLINGLFPVLWIFLTSLKTEIELAATPITWLPEHASLANYQQAFTEQPLLLFLFNSLAIAFLSALLALVISIGAAYAFARLALPKAGLLLVALIALAMCPPATLQIPLFEMMRALGLLNTWLALILPNAVLSLPVCILVLVAFFKSLPESLEHAAMLDGCSRLGALWRIVLPLSLPGVITAGTLAFVNAWDEFLLALVLNAAPENRTLPVGILFYQGEFTIPWPLISAALIVGIVPLVVLIAFSQQRLVGNLTAGGMKG